MGAAIALDPEGTVDATDLEMKLALPNSRIRAQLRALTEGGYLRPLPSLSARKTYEPVPSRFWDACLELIERAAGE